MPRELPFIAVLWNVMCNMASMVIMFSLLATRGGRPLEEHVKEARAQTQDEETDSSVAHIFPVQNAAKAYLEPVPHRASRPAKGADKRTGQRPAQPENHAGAAATGVTLGKLGLPRPYAAPEMLSCDAFLILVTAHGGVPAQQHPVFRHRRSYSGRMPAAC